MRLCVRDILTASEVILVLSVKTVAEFVAFVFVRYADVGLGAQERIAVTHFRACNRRDEKQKTTNKVN